MWAAIVTDPVEGMERWFEPGREILVANDAAEALAHYRELFDDPGAAEELGARARERVLDEHTYAQRRAAAGPDRDPLRGGGRGQW